MDKERPNSDLPPPGHPMNDIMRMTGIIPPRPDEPNAMLEKIFGKGKTQREVIASTSRSPPPKQASSPEGGMDAFEELGRVRVYVA